MKTLYILLLLVVIIIATLVYQKIMDTTEGFANVQPLPVLNSCPHSMQTLHDPKTGDESCCDGRVEGTDCLNGTGGSGQIVCAKTPSASSSLKDCREYLKDYNDAQATKFCNPNMPLYYESNDSSSSGCASQVNDATTAPIGSTNTCKVHIKKENGKMVLDVQQNMFDGNSCENQKMQYKLQNSSFCSDPKKNCSVRMGGNGQNIVWVNAFYNKNIGSNDSGQTACEGSESKLRHALYGWWQHDPLKGEELEKAKREILAGTYAGMCPDGIVKSIPHAF